jgi:hypothetical protein
MVIRLDLNINGDPAKPEHAEFKSRLKNILSPIIFSGNEIKYL